MKFNCELKKTVDDSYDIEIGRDLSDMLIEDLKNGLVGNITRYVVVTDSNVQGLYAVPIMKKLEAAGFTADMVVIPAGERSKTREMKEYIEDAMLEKGCHRDCCIIAAGGGVVSDIAGFTAGTFARGIPFIIYSTTLLAAADASIGGKTAVDTPIATNLIGLFYQPKKVYIDINTWRTLPERELRSGLAETIKHGCIGSVQLFRFLEENIEKILLGDDYCCEYIAKMNCEVKYKVVMKDERESGLREVLNLGHTVGRAIETVSDYELLHGEAVAIGLAAQVQMGMRLGYISLKNAQRVTDLISRAGLPVAIPSYIDKKELIEKLYTDKKVRGGKLRFVFQKEIGDMMCFGENVYSKEISEAYAAEIIEKM